MDFGSVKPEFPFPPAKRERVVQPRARRFLTGMRELPAPVLLLRSAFLASVRGFFHSRGFCEIEAPLLAAHGTAEPFLDNLELKDPRSQTPAFLLTSPEAPLKITLSELPRPLFQIAHVWRARDAGPLHTQEFLMLEWYVPGFDEWQLMQQIEELLHHLVGDLAHVLPAPPVPLPQKIPVHSIAGLLQAKAGCGFDRPGLEAAALGRGLATPEELARDRYDELFFRVFLDAVEPHLQKAGPLFIHGYPAELAAYSRVENGVGRRFEWIWDGVELANGYLEVIDPSEQSARVDRENALRRTMGKPERPLDPAWVAAMQRGIPECAGVAVGLERLLMVLSGANRIEEVSPFD